MCTFLVRVLSLTGFMEEINYLIIGGGVAGTTAAETIRKVDPSGSITIVSDEPYRFYSRILLSKPNFFLEKIPFDQIWLKTEAWYKDQNIHLIAGKKAVLLDGAGKTVMLDDGTKLKYQKLLLAVGGYARAWDVPGADKRGVFYLRTLDDAKAVIAAMKTAKRAVAIGGGFVSFEMCDMLRLAGLPVTLIIREPHYWDPILDELSGRMVEAALEQGGVKIFRNAEVAEMRGGDNVEGVTLKDGTEIPCELIIAGLGVFCPLDFAKEAGVLTNRGILANEYLETNVPDIWAAGDAAEFKDLILGGNVQLGNWVNAQMQGRIAGANMTGKREPFRLVSFYTTQGFGITIGFVGDIRPGADRTIIPRRSPETNSYARLIVKDGELVGATLINRAAELGAISKLIAENVKVSGREKDFANADIKLETLIS